MTQDIPVGRTKEDIKARERIIKTFYSPKNKAINSEECWLVWLGLETTSKGHKGCHPFCEFPFDAAKIDIISEISKIWSSESKKSADPF